jgi:hypothetical protein
LNRFHSINVAVPNDVDAVKHPLFCRIEQRPPRLDLENYSHLPPARVRTTQPSEYLALLGEVNS